MLSYQTISLDKCPDQIKKKVWNIFVLNICFGIFFVKWNCFEAIISIQCVCNGIEIRSHFTNVYNINWLVLNEWPSAAAYTKECMNNHSTEFDEILTKFFFIPLFLSIGVVFFFSKKKLVHNTYIWNISHVCYSGTSFCILLSRKQLNHSHYTFIFRRARFHFMYCFTD